MLVVSPYLPGFYQDPSCTWTVTHWSASAIHNLVGKTLRLSAFLCDTLLGHACQRNSEELILVFEPFGSSNNFLPTNQHYYTLVVDGALMVAIATVVHRETTTR